MAIVAPPVPVDVYALPPARPWYTDVWVRMLRRKPLGTVGGAIVLVMLLGAVFADVLTPYGFSQTSLAWVVNAYLITFGGLLLLAGRLGDLIGRRTIFLADTRGIATSLNMRITK